MSRVLIYSGTTEGRDLAYRLSDYNIDSVVSVATDYGEMMMEKRDNIKVITGRLDVGMMRELTGFDAVIDATHPFATEVTENILKSLSGTDVPYYRLSRATECEGTVGCTFFDSVEECIEALLARKATGKILITTGSKDINAFALNESLRDRLLVRVLPAVKSLEICYEAGIDGRQIIAMQGPFSTKMNLAQIKEYGIDVLVTKESGRTGGLDSKIEACAIAGIDCYIIRRPDVSEGIREYNTDEIVSILCDRFGKSCEGILDIALCGIGMGAYGCQTVEVADRIKKSDYIFGAERMLDAVKTGAVRYPFYTPDKIIPILDTIRTDGKRARVTVLFSGDSGFFSGSHNMYEALVQNSGNRVTVMPGISSIAYLSAKAGINWQQSVIISAHGVNEDKWIPELVDGCLHSHSTFFITSGPEDVKKIIDLAGSVGIPGISVIIGRNLSYDDEEILTIIPGKGEYPQKEGLYCGIIINDNPVKKLLCPVIKDEDMIRGNVPMTKEEVRHLSVLRLNAHRGDVIADIGAGTGSVSVEIAGMSPDVQVYSIESSDEALALIKENIDKLSLNNVHVIKAMAPDGLSDIPVPACAFIGGSRGRLSLILNKLYEINNHMRVVMNAVSMESICEMNNLIKDMSVENVEITQVSVSRTRTLGNVNILQSGNPVFIFSFDFV